MNAPIPVERGLVPGLNSYQILFITISGTIGIGFATTTGLALAISGPGGVLVAFGVVGVVAIAVMEGVCEMIVMWPIPNAMIEFVRAFVDRDFAIVVGIAYWYSYVVNLASILYGCVILLTYWPISNAERNVSLAVFLVFVYAANCFGVKIFGWIELVGGIVKLLIVFGIFLIMMLISQGDIGDGGKIGATFFNDGVRNNPNVASSHFTAVMLCIPIAIFAYIGVELVTVCAFEARNPSQLMRPAKNIAYIMTAIYLISIGGFITNVEWFNQSLQVFLEQPLVAYPGSNDTSLGHAPWPFSHSSSRAYAAPVIAVLQVGIQKLPGIMVGFLVYSGLSCGVTTLYVASRTLYGLTRDLSPTDPNWFVRRFATLNVVSSTRHVPVWSLIASLFAVAAWLPFIKLKSELEQNEVQEILVAVGSVGAVIVWASQCLAYIRYHTWLGRHRDMLEGENLGKYHRWAGTGFHSYAAILQPVPAWVGLISCVGIIFGLNALSMLKHSKLIFKALSIYLGPGILLLIFIILKLWNRRLWVRLGNWESLRATLNHLESLIYRPLANNDSNSETQSLHLTEHPYHPNSPPPLPIDNVYAPQYNARVRSPTNDQARTLPPTIEELMALRNQNPGQNQNLNQNTGHSGYGSESYGSGSEDRGRSHSPSDGSGMYRGGYVDMRQGSAELSGLSPVSPVTEMHAPYMRSAYERDGETDNRRLVTMMDGSQRRDERDEGYRVSNNSGY